MTAGISIFDKQFTIVSSLDLYDSQGSKTKSSHDGTFISLRWMKETNRSIVKLICPAKGSDTLARTIGCSRHFVSITAPEKSWKHVFPKSNYLWLLKVARISQRIDIGIYLIKFGESVRTSTAVWWNDSVLSGFGFWIPSQSQRHISAA